METASRLLGYFEGYYDFLDARIPAENTEYRRKVQEHLQRLEHYTGGPCPGCRENPSGCCIEGCTVRICIKERKLDFCADCPDFPCKKTEKFFAALDPIILGDWKRGTERLREIGPEAYFMEKKNASHYKSFKK